MIFRVSINTRSGRHFRLLVSLVPDLEEESVRDTSFVMMKVAGHQQTRILELDGYGHGMVEPALPLLLEEVRRVTTGTE